MLNTGTWLALKRRANWRVVYDDRETGRRFNCYVLAMCRAEAKRLALLDLVDVWGKQPDNFVFVFARTTSTPSY